MLDQLHGSCDWSVSRREDGLTTKAVKKALHRTFKAMDEEVVAAEQAAPDPEAEHAGTTASIALQLGKHLYVADVGACFCKLLSRHPWLASCGSTALEAATAGQRFCQR